MRIFVGGGSQPGLFHNLDFPGEPGVTAGWIRLEVFVPAMILGSWLWWRRFGHGPLEGAMRWFSDRMTSRRGA